MSCGELDDDYIVNFLVENQYKEELKEVNVYVFPSMRNIPNKTLTTPLPDLRKQLAEKSEQNQKVENIAVTNTSPQFSFNISFTGFGYKDNKVYFVLAETINNKVISKIFSFGPEGGGGSISYRYLNDITTRIIVDKNGKIK